MVGDTAPSSRTGRYHDTSKYMSTTRFITHEEADNMQSQLY